MSNVNFMDALRKHPEYIRAYEKIKGYPQGFTFEVPFCEMNNPQKKAMCLILEDCVKDKLIESFEMSLNLNGEVTSEKYKRL